MSFIANLSMFKSADAEDPKIDCGDLLLEVVDPEYENGRIELHFTVRKQQFYLRFKLADLVRDCFE